MEIHYHNTKTYSRMIIRSVHRQNTFDGGTNQATPKLFENKQVAIPIKVPAYPRKMLLLRAGIEGMKKYSPPLGTINCGTVNVSRWLFGSRPLKVRCVASPITGSTPGVMGLNGGKLHIGDGLIYSLV
jgi:hypothetical protein